MKGEQDLASRHGRATHACQAGSTPRQRQGGVKCMICLEKWEVSEQCGRDNSGDVMRGVVSLLAKEIFCSQLLTRLRAGCFD